MTDAIGRAGELQYSLDWANNRSEIGNIRVKPRLQSI